MEFFSSPSFVYSKLFIHMIDFHSHVQGFRCDDDHMHSIGIENEKEKNSMIIHCLRNFFLSMKYKPIREFASTEKININSIVSLHNSNLQL